ncbi:ankyrin repeat domain-containing protein [Rhodopirellula sp. JC740]|uniref:Ankyrin repeat domain-containing protein n=1 Tax=Rhodopirellula halodulae TaxID=2894198 RepID=A0ABS8NDJ9_9BACT|nr:ankyrin repeat domain-containing protein [Rhodopirellula sp. JC740]MCC9641613.1 ankyrin repeat domain-containing protein [Rhodopirellula sp. JC740]
MPFRLRTILSVVTVIAVALMLTMNWLRRPVTGRTLDGQKFQLAGHDALIHCVMTNDATALRRLLAMDSYELDRVGDPGDWTLLQHALHPGCVETTELLLDNGANPNLAGNGTPHPLELARRNGHPDLIAVLSQFGATEPATTTFDPDGG